MGVRIYIKIFSLSSFSSTEKREREKKKNRIAKRCARVCSSWGVFRCVVTTASFCDVFSRAVFVERRDIFSPDVSLLFFKFFATKYTFA